jgi:multiple sugar transport system substrate-binding protein
LNGHQKSTKFSIICISILIILALAITGTSATTATNTSTTFDLIDVSSNQKKQVTLTAMLDDQGDPPRLLPMLFQPALEELRARHPDIEIQLDFRPIPSLNLYSQFLATMSNQTPVDIMTVDRISLGEFVEKGFLTDLTDYAKKWGRQKDWYTANWDGGIYNDRVYGIWTVADVRGIWYWKDLLNEAHVHPDLLKAWDEYISSAKELNKY